MLSRVSDPIRIFFLSLGAKIERYFRAREIIKVLKVMQAQEMVGIPGEQWNLYHKKHVAEIQAVKSGDWDIIDRRTWAFPYIPESLHRLNQPILKNTPYNLRRFSETPVPRRAINLIKNTVIALRWKVEPTPDAMEANQGEIPPELAQRIKALMFCLQNPNDSESWRDISSSVLEDIIVGDYGTVEPRLTPDFRRPFKWWAVDGPYSSDTQVLTKRGWIEWPEVRLEDFLATRNPRGCFEWQRPLKIFKQTYHGDMVHFFSRGVDLLVSPCHRMYGYRVRGTAREEGRLEFLPAEMVAGMEYSGDGENSASYPFRIPTTSTWKGSFPKGQKQGKKITLSYYHKGYRREIKESYVIRWEDWAAFLGIFLAEGSCDKSFSRKGIQFRKNKDPRPHYVQAMAAAAEPLESLKDGAHGVAISQAPTSKHYEEIKSLLARLPFPFYEPRWMEGGFRVGSKALHNELLPLGNKYTKHIPEEIKNLPPKYQKILVDWLVKGDGSLHKDGRNFDYYTASRSLADDLQEVLQKTGMHGKIREVRWNHPAGEEYNYRTAPNYVVQSRTRTFVGVGKRSAEKVSYSGDIYCATVPNQTLYVRRNGKPIWCGNTTIRIFADWSESMPDKPKYAQLTGLKGERGIISFRDDELSYMRCNVRSSTPFGLGKLEVAFNSVNALLGAQDMSARAAADQIHKTWLWWENSKITPYQLQTVRRHVQNEVEGEGKVSLMSGVPRPEVLEVNPVRIDDLLLDWQEFCIRIIANAFDLSSLAMGLEKDVNYNTSQTLSEMDFKSAAMPVAVCFAEHLNRDIIWKLLGWRDIQFSFVGMTDPDAETQSDLNKADYASNFITPDEVRANKGLPDLPGGWGKLTFGQMQILVSAARGPSSGAAGGVARQAPINPQVLLQMTPEQLEWLTQNGWIQNPGQEEEEEQQDPLTEATQNIQNFLEEGEGRDGRQTQKLSGAQKNKLAKAQEQRFKATEHQQTREEKMARDIEKRRQYSLTRRPKNSGGRKKQGNEFTSSLPGGV